MCYGLSRRRALASRSSVMLSFSQMPPPLTLPGDLGGRSLVFLVGVFDPFIGSFQFQRPCVAAAVRIRLRSDSRNFNSNLARRVMMDIAVGR